MKRRPRERKNYLPTALLTLFFWLVLVGLIVFVDPIIVRDVGVTGVYLPFFLLLFFCLFLTLALLLNHSRRGAFISVGVIIFLFLRLKGLGNGLNFLLLVALIATADYYFSQRVG